MANCVQCGRQLPAFTFGKKLCQWCVQHEAAQRGEDSPIQRVEPAPWMRRQSSSMAVTKAIFGINVAVFVAMTLAVGVTVFGDPAWHELARNRSMDTGHLPRFTLITGLAASLMSVAWHSQFPVSSVGASGAIFGIAGALIASFYLGEFSLSRAAMTGMLRSVVTFVGYNLFFGAVIAGTDNAAHIGGVLMGLLLRALIARVAPQHDDAVRRVGVLALGMVLVYGGAAWLHHSHAYLLHAATEQRLLTENKTEQAIAELQTAIRQRPGYLPAHYELARAYWIKGDFASAEGELKRVIELDPEDERAYFSLGMARLGENCPQLARDSFAQLLRLNPKSADAHFGLGTASATEQKYPEALEEFKLTAKLDPDYDGVDQEIGRMQAGLKLYDDAIASFLKQQKIAHNPKNENALASAYEAKGMHREAEQARQPAKHFQD